MTAAKKKNRSWSRLDCSKKKKTLSSLKDLENIAVFRRRET